MSYNKKQLCLRICDRHGALQSESNSVYENETAFRTESVSEYETDTVFYSQNPYIAQYKSTKVNSLRTGCLIFLAWLAHSHL